MLFSRSIMIQTKESKGKVVELLRKVIETQDSREGKYYYSGAFTEEGFIAFNKTGPNSSSEIVIYGKFESSPAGTRMIVDFHFTWLSKIVFWVANIILFIVVFKSLLKSSYEWHAPLGILSGIWVLAVFILWLNIRNFKKVVVALFDEPR